MENSIPKRISACFMDIAEYSLGMYVDNQLHMVLNFDTRLDVSRLERAMRLCLDAEPVLGCRLIYKSFKPYWLRLSNTELNNKSLLSVEEGEESILSYKQNRFFAEPLEVEKGPQIKAALLRYESGDRLILKLNHIAGDAGGVKDLSYLIAQLYRFLGENSNYTPSPNLSSRGLGQIFSHLSLFHKLSLLPKFVVQVLTHSIPYKSIQFPVDEKKENNFTYVFKRFSSSRVQHIKAFGKKRGATLNDIIATAVLKSLDKHVKVTEGRAMRIRQTFDLRRYLPDGKADAICHLSSLFYPSIERKVHENFDQTLYKVKKDIDGLKRDHYSLLLLWCNRLSLKFAPFFMKKYIMQKTLSIGYKNQKMPVGCTNMGIINKESLNFGDITLLSAELVVCASKTPEFSIGVSGFSDTLIFSSGFYESAVTKSNVEEFFKRIDAELP